MKKLLIPLLITFCSLAASAQPYASSPETIKSEITKIVKLPINIELNDLIIRRFRLDSLPIELIFKANGKLRKVDFKTIETPSDIKYLFEEAAKKITITPQSSNDTIFMAFKLNLRCLDPQVQGQTEFATSDYYQHKGTDLQREHYRKIAGDKNGNAVLQQSTTTSQPHAANPKSQKGHESSTKPVVITHFAKYRVTLLK